ncbi:MAG TPA: MMPL family transporter, partial [Kofleriaceae bacterium]|nr:MMPL family transporter [Kofleriaceae bacterium]
VRDLEALRDRARAFGTVFIIVEADDPKVREQGAQALYRRLQELQLIHPELFAHVSYDDRDARQYAWNNRFLFADLADLEEARRALADRIHQAKLAANPIYVDFDDQEQKAPDDLELDKRVSRLQDKLKRAEADAKAPRGFVSDDGRMQLLIVRSTAPTADLAVSRPLMEAIEAAIADTRAEVPVKDIGMTGDVVSTLYENRAIMRGMLLAAVVTVVLCALALLWYYRSGLAVLMVMFGLAVGTLTTFGLARLLIGELNVMTAFLAAIVVGNGVNPSLMLLARYFEEARAGRPGADGMGAALGGAAWGTGAAALAAAVAYGSLVVTEFRGFRHFGVIGFTGMLLCWGAAFLVLPAGLAALRRRGWLRIGREPAIGRMLGHLVPRRRWLVAAIGGVVLLVAGAVTAEYVASGPLEKDWRNLRSDSAELQRAHAWDERMGAHFDPRFKAGLSQRFVLAVDHPNEVAAVVGKLKAAPRTLIESVTTIDDLLPTDQKRKLQVLTAIRKLLADDAVAQLDDADRATIERIRPPPDLRPLEHRDIPEELDWPFIEQDGTAGRLILAAGSSRFQTWDVDDRLEFARGVRGLKLPDDVAVGGQAFVIADIIASMSRDGPLAALAAVIGSLLMVALVVGFRRHGLITVISGAAGILGMVAMCALLGLKVHFIDLVALPITIGIGIEYAVNLAARDRLEPEAGPRRLLATTGGAVLLCSYTTIVGYGSLLLSANAGIRSFGLAAITGELTCLVAALTLTPTLLSLWRPGKERGVG